MVDEFAIPLAELNNEPVIDGFGAEGFAVEFAGGAVEFGVVEVNPFTELNNEPVIEGVGDTGFD
jgi:hypothetical protein